LSAVSASAPCPSDDLLDGFARGALEASERTQVEAHIDECEACCAVVSELALLAGSLVVDGDLLHTGAGLEPGERLGEGATLGRYRLESCVGAGGMGVVYAAFDPDLDRRVALKLMHGFSGDDEGARLRLLREAQAMAQLSHPNVVAVHDVGTMGTVVFLAMELVEGGTLGTWMEEGPHGWRSVVERFIAAGKGLAAAHVGGLVHRDFKPDNVLLDRDGRARVTDFGLARPAAGPSMAMGRSPSGRPLTMDLTRAGSIMGTPAYMSPEQHAGQVADARSDQFSYCVALWEALYGRRPFVGRTMAQLALALEAGPPAPPSSPRVPGRIVRALRRGLSPDPNARFATMGALLQELEHARNARRGLWLATGLGGLGLIGGTAMATAYLVDDPLPAGVVDEGPVVDACGGGEEQIEEIWNDEVRAQVVAAFEAADPTQGAAAARRTVELSDAWTERWARVHREACEATHVRRERSLELLERSQRCLQQGRDALRARLDVLVGADAAVVRRIGATATLGLREPETCADRLYLESQVAPPASEDQREAVAAVRRLLADAAALVDAGRYEEARGSVEQSLTDAKSSGYAPAVAEAHYRHGVVLDRLGLYELSKDAYTEAVWSARAAGHGEVELWAATMLIGLEGEQLARHEEALRWARHAQAQIDRLGEAGRPAQAEVLGALGSLHFSRGEYVEAARHHRAALAIREELHGEGHYDTAVALHNLAGALVEQGKFAEAEALRIRAVAAAEAALGPEHPRLASFVRGLAIVSYRQGEYDAALIQFQRAYEIREASLGSEHPDVATALNDLGAVLKSKGDLEAAHSRYMQALVLRQKVLPADHPQIAQSLANVSGALSGLGRYEEAREYLDQALELRRQTLGATHPDVASTLNRLGNLEHKLGRFEGAIERYEQSIAIMEESLGRDHVDLVMPLGNLASSLRRLDRFDEALAMLARALKIAETSYEGGHPRVATLRTTMAVIYGRQGKIEDSLANHREALALRERLLGSDHPDTADSVRHIARIYGHRGQHEDAVREFARALAVYEGHGDLPFRIAETRFWLAKAMVDAGGDLEKARGLAERAREEFAAIPDGGNAKMVAKVDAWLAG